MAASFAVATPDSAQAAPRRAKTITRAQVISRAKSWVKRRVPYSQRRYFRGYRQDCSGFVSMAWGLGKSYTTRSISSVSKRVSPSKARPGDAVLTPGHVVIFGGWKNKRAKTFYAYHEPRSGKVASRSIRTMRAGSKVLRRKGIKDRAVVKRSTPPAPVALVPVIPPAPVESEVGVVVAGIVEAAPGELPAP